MRQRRRTPLSIQPGLEQLTQPLGVLTSVLRPGSLRYVPATPAEVPLNTVTQDASPLIRQLEHRVRDLPALAQRLTTRSHSALSEADAARHALTQPFKYAAELE